MPVSVGQFVSMSAHDIIQPLNVLQMYMGILQSEAGISEEDELAQAAGDSLQSMHSMINLLVNWGRAENGALRIQPDALDLSGWYNHICSITEVHCSGSDFRSINSSAQKEPRQVDMRLLTQTLHDMATLLPENTIITLSNTIPWDLEINATKSSDALHQLALIGGGKILEALGVSLEQA